MPLTNLFRTLTSDVAALNNTITTNVQTLNGTITWNGNSEAIDVNNVIVVMDSVTFCTVTPTELKQSKNVSSNTQQPLANKGKVIVTNSALSATQTELQGEITASAAAITTAYPAADVVVASSAAAALSAASTS